MKWTLLAIT
ncbi:outer membrane insertion C-terminal signal domain protein, partial [Vibrio harveyi]